jgi:hypothetical protein
LLFRWPSWPDEVEEKEKDPAPLDFSNWSSVNKKTWLADDQFVIS